MVIVVLSVGCQGAGPVAVDPVAPTTAQDAGPQAHAVEPSWWSEVSSRLDAEERAFVADGDGFVGGQRGLVGRFDGSGATLRVGEQPLTVRTVGYGRDRMVDPALDVAPHLGACVPGARALDGRCVQRLELPGAGLTEWWVSRPDGLEQGWTIDAAPTGMGPLSIELTVDGGDARVESDSVWLSAEDGSTVLVSDLHAWDADGVPLDAWFEAHGAGVRVSVDDAGARFPITVDPVYQAAAWTTLGDTAVSSFGALLGGAGDVNGDGFDDVWVRGDAVTETKVFVFYGSGSGLAPVPGSVLTGLGSDGFGTGAAGVGDVNHDGFADVAVGAPTHGGGKGALFVYLGGASGLSETPVATVAGVATGEEFGAAVAAAGDVNGDSFDDILAGAPTGDQGQGKAVVVYGSATGISTAAVTTVVGPDLGPFQFGAVVSGAGDVNHDTFADVMVGSPNFSSPTVEKMGRVYVYLGGAAGLSSSPASTLTSAFPKGYLGASMAPMGDTNGDGYDDVLLGAPGVATSKGQVHLYRGASSGVPNTATRTWSGTIPVNIGATMANVGDINADGWDDAALGTLNPSTGVKSVVMLHGSASGLPQAYTATLTSPVASGGFGAVLAGAGDVDGDGKADALIVADSGSETHALVYPGSTTGLKQNVYSEISPPLASHLGFSVALVGDVNGDHYDDAVVGAPAWGLSTGEAFVFAGSASGFAATASRTLRGEAPGDRFAAVVAGAGDVNDDGYADVVIGAPDHAADVGRVYVYLGSAGGLASAPAATLDGESGAGTFGAAVATAGDVDGDGHGDLIVGAPALALGAGKAYVFQGNATGVSSVALWTRAGSTASQQLGRRVSGAGDVNGDGYADVVVGAEGPSSQPGAALVFHGSPTGPSLTANTTLSGEGAGDAFGASVVGLGDTNADGFEDVAVGAPRRASAHGRVYVYLGSATGLVSSPSSTLSGVARDGEFGNVLARAGDVNGDGRDDLLVGVEAYDVTVGRVYYFPSTPLGFVASARTPVPGSGGAFGGAVGGGGDADGDGFDDVIVGAQNAGLGASVGRGAAFLFRGYSGDEDGDGYSDGVDCDDRDPSAHPGGTEVCDALNGDQDCNGLAEDADPGLSLASRLTWWPDTDGDTFGGGATPVLACDAPDGFVADHTDCDDTSSSIRPGGLEVCDAASADEDCDGLSDNADSSVNPATKTTFYLDTDGDGYGGSTTGRFCDVVPGYAATNLDCNDANNAISPSAQEVCDASNVDEDCDAKADDADSSVSPAGFSSFFRDQDLDGYGGPTTTLRCDAGLGATATSTDCDDTTSAIRPNGQEVCDLANVDEDCDGLSDNLDSSAAEVTRTTYYTDADGDGYGAPGSSVRLCDVIAGVSLDNTDCNDTSASISPFAAEVCDSGNVDEDCDGVADNADPKAAVATKTTFYVDSDGDGYGGNTSGKFCDRPNGYSATHDDCNESSSGINPGAQEVCDPSDVDEDCDALADDADSTVSEASKLTFYVDGDVDGYGGATTTRACAKPSGATLTSTDCNDAAAAIHPGAQEVCDPANADEDCDALSDDLDPSVSPASRLTFYVDGDGDGFGSSSTALSCDLHAGLSNSRADCDDTHPNVYPGAQEVCDAADLDEDCDGMADDRDQSVLDSTRTTFFVDADRDGFGSITTTRACDLAAGRTSTAGDCNDAAIGVNPSAQEICDQGNVDEDCDGVADDLDVSVADATRFSFYADSDGDGYGVGTPTRMCDLRQGFGPLSGDCDDSASGAHPGATEVCDPADVDEDCDALADDADSSTSIASKTSYYGDADGDGYGGGTPTLSCNPVPGKVTTASDCNDAVAAIHPGATEVCDASDVDEDCDGAADDADASVASNSQTTFHPDSDLDGYGNANISALRCDAAAGQLTDGTDCNDAVSSTHPGATDVAADGVDANCDTFELCYVDADRDGARLATTVASADLDCLDAGEATATALLDCDDGDPLARPGAPELIGDGVDEDCDGHEVCYVDLDDDGYRVDAIDTVTSADADCLDVGEALATDLVDDCDDSDVAFHPSAPETDCTDPADYNCDGSTGFADADSDGWPACDDCDDLDGDVRPDAVEIAGDGLDSNCDAVDLCYIDVDDDGYRVDATHTFLGTTAGCNGGGEATRDDPAGDCDDAAVAVHPGAVEAVGDGVDEDCNGQEACYVDADADGARPNAVDQVASTDADCADAGEAPATAALDDCNDRDAAVRPGLTDRTGDGVDSNCDGVEVCFVDADGDGYRPNLIKSVTSADTDCSDFGEALSTALAGDCDDAQAQYHPGAAESDCADPHDYNCDMAVAYVDNDHDSYAACLECNDTNASVNPGAVEVAGDRVDANCDGQELCFVDADNDGGRPDATSTLISSNVACDGVGEAVSTDPTTDCDDGNPLVGPLATEILADGIDQDCDGAEDCYSDADRDGYRPDSTTGVASADLDCTDPGEATAALPMGDCDDDSTLYHPGASETQCGDGEDYNCDGATGYTDHDGDGFAACDECDDGDVDVNPDASERCNGIDDDCDSDIDESTAADAQVWFADADADGFTTMQSSVVACEPPDGFMAASESTDCDDASDGVYPGATEIPDDGIDQDCVGGDLVTDDETDTQGDDTDVVGPPGDGGCDCDSGGAPRVGLLGLLLGFGALRRRRLRLRA